MPNIHVVISGRVQGVGYRAWVVSTASKHKLQGWVRNRSNGTVEAVFSGENDAIDAMLKACKKGPMMARVDKIETFAWNADVDDGPLISWPTL